MQETLLVIITDRLSHIIAKGELIDRYYNPGGLFKHVHILMTNDDKPDIEALQRTVGDAKLTLHNLPSGMSLLAKTLWRPFLLKKWAEQGIELAKEIKPQLVRCYGNFLNGYIGARIREELNIPLFVSLHTQPDATRSRTEVGFKTQVFYHLSKALEKYTLKYADKVSCVYGSIVDYARNRGVKNPITAYNVINSGPLSRKQSYCSKSPLQILYVGRLIPAKNPENIIKGMQGKNVELTIVGSGTKEIEMKKLSSTLGLNDKIHFIPALTNDELCRTMHEYDIFAGHSQYSELPKTVLEASLCGLPILVNSRKGKAVPEYKNGWAMLVDDSPEGYSKGIDFFSNEDNRKKFGEMAAKYADSHWNPNHAESVFTEIHRTLTNS
ncbi:glycosyltransferase [Maridesulfovibrio ferrireducens]|uniref:glycosyltransferase n=1 Tax=Maridesulfovibrio ferrireducens TaxID=246191 RepID=UPI001A2D760F|nr:glycosyltransferase [Maridesulfovibrio ferrireducens]MBI9112682.1 glycosyltransferase [Maridesulfovibrio ferrireducens]